MKIDAKLLDNENLKELRIHQNIVLENFEEILDEKLSLFIF